MLWFIFYFIAAADLFIAMSSIQQFSSVIRYLKLWRHLGRYRINTNFNIKYIQKPHTLTFNIDTFIFFLL